jgi:P-type conjugative transfer protein TrbJ
MTEPRTRMDSRVINLQNPAAGRRSGSPTTTRPRRRSDVPLLAFALALALIAAPVATVGQIAVIDAANVVQTTISALKAIESVINEVEMIANQVKQIETMIQNTQNYGRGVWDTEAQPRLLRLGQVIEQEQAIAYTMVNVDGVFRQRYPGYRPVADWSREYDSWTRTTLDTLRGSLNSVRLHAEDFATEQGRIQALQGLSDSADGRMQALQLGNMMAGEQLQQLVKLRQLMMAQVNAQTVYMASQTNRDAQRAATQSEWIRNGNTDAPAMPTGGVGR